MSSSIKPWLRLQTLGLHPPLVLREYHFNNFIQPYCAILRGSAFSSIAKSSTGCQVTDVQGGKWDARNSSENWLFCQHLLLDSFQCELFAIWGRQSKSVLILIITASLFSHFFSLIFSLIKQKIKNHQCRTDVQSVTCIHSSHCNILSFTYSYPALVLHNSIWWFHIFTSPHDSVQEVLHTIKRQYWRKK